MKTLSKNLFSTNFKDLVILLNVIYYYLYNNYIHFIDKFWLRYNLKIF